MPLPCGRHLRFYETHRRIRWHYRADRVVRPYKALYECAMVRTDLQLPTARAG